MGAAWCRHRAERAHDSKSPLDRVIVRCVDKFYSVDPNATPVRLSRPTPGGVSTVCGNESITEELLLNSSRRDISTPVRPMASAGAWQKASLQVPRAEEPLMAKSAPAADAPLARTPVPPPRRKRASAPRSPTEAAAAPSTPATRPPPPPRPQDSPSAPSASAHLLSPPKPRPAHTSTVSLPEWRDLERPDDDDDVAKQPPRPSSTSPRPQYLRPPSVTSVSDATLERVETYLRRCRSFGNMSSSGLVDKLSSIDADSDEEEDPWEGVDDFEHAFHPHRGSPPHTPRSRVDRRKGTERQNSDPTSPSVGERKRRSGAVAAPISTSTPIANSSIVDSLPGLTPPADEISCGRFFISSAEEEWFTREYHRESESASPPETKNAAASSKEPEQEICEVKKELQSIIYDYNRTKKISTTSIGEVLPTQPVRTSKKKKISVASITPPPSPVSSDLEEDESTNIPATAIINGESNGDGNTHSTLLRLLRECQNIEGALEDITNDESEMPRVHSALRQLAQNNRHIKENMESAKLVTQSLDSGLDMRGALDRGTQEVGEENPTGTPSVVKNVDSGVDEDDPQAAGHPKPNDTLEPVVGAAEDASKDGVVRRRRQTGTEDDAGSSSGRSSMTPSLSELEAALSDMLEKSAAAAADDDDRASPVSPEQTVIAKQAVSTNVPEDGAATKAEAEPSSPTTMLIPKISVTPDISPSVH